MTIHSAPQVTSWYILPNLLRPENRALDQRVVVTAVDHKMVHFETEAPAGWAQGTPLCMPLVYFRQHATPVV
ncbi:MAG: hypothetical protein ACYCY2_01050 [Acidithiobacillus ferriphilus]